MVKLEKDITNLKDSEIRVTVGDSITLTREKRGYNSHDGKLHCMKFSNMAVISGLHANFFSLTQALQESFQVT